MTKFKWSSIKIISAIILFTSVLVFQNCSEDVTYSVEKSQVDGGAPGSGDGLANDSGNLDGDGGLLGGNPEDPGTSGGPIGGGTSRPPVVCNPLDPTQMCDPEQESSGFTGKLYYLTVAQHAPLFNGNLRQAVLQDYRTIGIEVPVSIRMSNIDVSPRNWESGFFISQTEQVQTQNGDKLFEWFHLDMYGKISLPPGSYQVGTISDDGIRVTIQDQVVVDADGVHAPRWDCSNTLVNFAEDETKSIRVEYFQGPRSQIALQLFYRPAEMQGEECGDDGQFEIIPPEAFIE